MTARDPLGKFLAQYPISRLCAICGGVFRPRPTGRAKVRTCSPRCRAELISYTRTRYRPTLRMEVLRLRVRGRTLEQVAGVLEISVARAHAIVSAAELPKPPMEIVDAADGVSLGTLQIASRLVGLDDRILLQRILAGDGVCGLTLKIVASQKEN